MWCSLRSLSSKHAQRNLVLNQAQLPRCLLLSSTSAPLRSGRSGTNKLRSPSSPPNVKYLAPELNNLPKSHLQSVTTLNSPASEKTAHHARESAFMEEPVLTTPYSSMPSIAQATQSPLKVMVVNADGSSHERIVPKNALMHESKIAARDFVVLTAGFGRIPRPALLVRDEAFLMSLAFVRAVVRHDSIMFVLSTADEIEIRQFASRLANYIKSTKATSVNPASPLTNFAEGLDADFELRALEGVLSALTEQFMRRMSLLTPMLETVLKRLVEEPVFENFDVIHSQLLPLKDHLSRFEIEMTQLRDVFGATLRSDEDMTAMLLSERKRRGNLPPRKAHQPVELLLETYVSTFVGLAQEAYHLRKRVESNQSLYELKLDAHRNRLMQYNLHLTAASVALAGTAATCSVFGMNLTSGYESTPGMFYLVSFSACATAYFSFFSMRNRMNKNLSMASAHPSSPKLMNGMNRSSRPSEFDTIFDHIDEIEGLMGSGARQTAHSRSARDAFIASLRPLNISEEVASLVWSALHNHGRGPNSAG